ncbi:SDR family NAD(P)-dependent oxidoreductase [Kineococcus rubinsiae]|uniref:SDR family NAD(P)-dependent oxidoreductase n=1 Tax=Kineococcus rubinsiae TaxID=2609562 RepID=UPI001431E079|nr:SDR family oxidoreductase [Kineococcus rubinsiae]NIZ91286.1 SDR family oxidoreductase [Kineococcus rubinsiae]
MGALDGRVALVTGAASGMGAAIAHAYAAEGAQLVLADRDADRLTAAAAELGAEAHALDVTDADAVREVVDGVAASRGRLDVLVNCAGILTEVPLLEMDVETFDEMIAVDLRSVFLCSRFAAPHMVAAGWGRIISIASQLALKGGESLAHYSAAKAGVLGFTKAAARELAPHGVLVNAIAPGPILTPMIDGLSEEWKAAKQAELPLGRFGRPEEVAPTAVLLASDPGGTLYVGQTLGPNSGDVMP